MRAFSWGLLPLERKLEWERDACRMRVVQALAAVGRSQLHLRQLEALQREQDTAAAGAIRKQPDPQAHRNVLRYLASIQQRLQRAARQAHAEQEALALVRAECGRCEQRLEALVGAREAGMRGYIRAGLLRADRLADSAWLAHRQSARLACEGAP
ncbi:MAG TPA: hypothetical protein VIL30_23160 [Ramlibacter sp.]